ncbi:PLP-dependent transferase [Nanchangia anserum]|uniref:PLP-dependent transferase n=1 Tax=Nanchangia anserum TaxID=2692125 RepID=A0A8I0GBN8_9ACTO|nr:PLP-dependent transferase [Nanchangia anserum]MBD3689818.1 PLP-dependent transferase [Nanchangia anserum]QOX81987.1 PLP-dependent transferase [Nanchangia anserum]
MSSHRFETRQIHAGTAPDPTTGSPVLPLYQTSAYVFDSAEQAAQRFALAEPGPIYTRLANPTTDAVEARVADLEGGIGALAVSSGAGSLILTLTTIGRAGDNIVASPSLYGGSKAALTNNLPRLGIETRFVDDPADPASWEALADERTVAFFGETIPNPRGDILDIGPIADAAHRVGVPLIVDNTVATPYLTRPIEWGADLVIHSATKYLGGHGTSMLGLVVDAGRFDWTADPERFREFSTPDASYHGLVYGELGEQAFLVKARAQGQRDFGWAPSPFNAFLVNLGLETLSLRMERHCTNARSVAQWLEEHPRVTTVNYPGLESSPYHTLQLTYAPAGASGVLAFDIDASRDDCVRFVDALKLYYNVANIGDVRSLVAHPASTTHSQCTDRELAACGISASTIRLSIGLEHVDDLIADLERGFATLS